MYLNQNENKNTFISRLKGTIVNRWFLTREQGKGKGRRKGEVRYKFILFAYVIYNIPRQETNYASFIRKYNAEAEVSTIKIMSRIYDSQQF